MTRTIVSGPLVCLLGCAVAQTPTSGPGALVSAEWLKQHLDDPLVRVMFTGDRDQYDRAHIPGARFIDHMATNGADHRLLQPPEALAAVLAKAGAADGVRVILYGDAPMVTGWVFMAFAAVGHAKDVSMLDGNIEFWRAQGGSISTTAPPESTGRLTVQPAPDIVDAPWVRSRLASPAVRLLDVRTTGEWNSGHLPGATLVLWEDLIADQRTQKFKSIDEMKALFARAGVQPGQEVVTYCAVGMRASLMYWAAAAAGLPARVYVGSFQDWRKDAANPIVRP